MHHLIIYGLALQSLQITSIFYKTQEPTVARQVLPDPTQSINFYCLDDFVRHYSEHFASQDITVMGIESTLATIIADNTGAKALLAQDVAAKIADLKHYANTSIARPKEDKVAYITIKDILSFFLPTVKSGIYLDSNVMPLTKYGSQHHDHDSKPLSFYTPQITCRMTGTLTLLNEIFFMYTPPTDLMCSTDTGLSPSEDWFREFWRVAHSIKVDDTTTRLDTDSLRSSAVATAGSHSSTTDFPFSINQYSSALIFNFGGHRWEKLYYNSHRSNLPPYILFAGTASHQYFNLHVTSNPQLWRSSHTNKYKKNIMPNILYFLVSLSNSCEFHTPSILKKILMALSHTSPDILRQTHALECQPFPRGIMPTSQSITVSDFAKNTGSPSCKSILGTISAYLTHKASKTLAPDPRPQTRAPLMRQNSSMH